MSALRWDGLDDLPTKATLTGIKRNGFESSDQNFDLRSIYSGSHWTDDFLRLSSDEAWSAALGSSKVGLLQI